MGDLRTETTGADLAGSVTYRCAACGQPTEDVVVFVGEGKQTRAYHPDCIPSSEEDPPED